MTLALGIGANTAIFTVMNALVLKSLPVTRPSELQLFGDGSDSGTSTGIQSGAWLLFSYPFYRQVQEQRQPFEDLCAFDSDQSSLLVKAGGMPAVTAAGKLVSGNYFSVMGAGAWLGRTLLPEDDKPGAGRPVAVLSHRAWERLLSRDPDVLGRTVDINDTSFAIVGVMPPSFFGERLGGNPPDFWIPMQMQPQVTRRTSFLDKAGTHWLLIIGRLRPEIDPRVAQDAMTSQLREFMQSQLASQLAPGRQQVERSYIQLTPAGRGISFLRSRFSEPLRILIVVTGLVLLIACANIANLALARGAARQKEIAVRMAIGASRWRLVRQLLTESILLGLIGGAVGLLLAQWGASALVTLVARGAYLPLDIHPDWLVLVFTLGVSVATGALFGLAPALRAARLDLASAMKSGATLSGAGTGAGVRLGAARLLIVSQIALSLCALFSAALLLRTLENLVGQNLGFQPESVLVADIDPRLAGYKPEQLPALYQKIEERLAAMPGLRSASLALNRPLSGSSQTSNISIPGYTKAPDEKMFVERNLVSSAYFETMGIPLLEGRAFGPQDTQTAPFVAVVNQAMAARFFPGQDPVGKQFGFGDPPKQWIEIVGLVKNSKYESLRDDVGPLVFTPLLQRLTENGYPYDLAVRTSADPARLARELRSALVDVDANLPVARISALEEQVDRSATIERLIAQLASFFGLLAVLLACIGLYGVMAFTVSRRTNEIGIRMALGAQPGRVLRMVLAETIGLVLAGLVVGVPLAVAAGRLIRSQLFGLSPADPLTLGLAAGVLTLMAAIAGYLPARRAMKVDPSVALRYE